MINTALGEEAVVEAILSFLKHEASKNLPLTRQSTLRCRTILASSNEAKTYQAAFLAASSNDCHSASFI